jgi:hypothetical protein
MQIEIPYFYRGEAEFPRNRKNDLAQFHRAGIFLGTTITDIAEANPEDAPIALRVRYRGRDGGETLSEYRLLDGDFLEKDVTIVTGDRARGHVQATAEKLPRGAFAVTGDPVSHPVVRAFRAAGMEFQGLPWEHELNLWFAGRARDVPPPKTVMWEDRKSGEDEALAASSRIVLVDGMVWHRVPEPKIVLSMDRSARFFQPSIVVSTNEALGRRSFGSGRTDLSPLQRRFFHVADLERARAVFAEREPETELPEWLMEIEIVMPEAFSFDEGRSLLCRAASDFLFASGADLSSLEDEALAAWTDLRSALRSAQRSWSHDGSVRLLSSIETATRLLGTADARAAAAAAVDLYHTTPIGLDIPVPEPSFRP